MVRFPRTTQHITEVLEQTSHASHRVEYLKSVSRSRTVERRPGFMGEAFTNLATSAIILLPSLALLVACRFWRSGSAPKFRPMCRVLTAAKAQAAAAV